MIHNITLRRWTLLWSFLAALILTQAAQAATWFDPSWPEMLKNSDLIVLAEVVEGGKFVAKVKVVKTFKGKAPKGAFWVDNFNDPQTDEKSIDQGKFQNGEMYYLFLCKAARAQPGIEIVPATDKKNNRTVPEDYARALTAKQVFSTWTPTAGNFPLVDKKVRFALHWTTFSRYRGQERTVTEFETIVEKGVAFQTTNQKDNAFLDNVMKQLTAEYNSKEKIDLGHRLLTLCYTGETRYSDLFGEFTKHDSANARVPLARLLGQIEGPKAEKLLLALLKDKHSIVQGEAARQLAKGDPKVVGPAMVAELPTAGRAGIGPKGLMDPVRNEIRGGLLEIIHVLGEIKYEPAAKELLPLLDREDPQLLAATIDTLIKLNSDEYVAYLEKQLKNGSKAARFICDLAKAHKLTALKSAFEGYLENAKDANRYDRRQVIATLGELGDEGSAKVLHKLLKGMLAEERQYSRDDADTMTDLVHALADLKYTPAKATVYETIFLWFGVDDVMAARPELIALKEKTEKDTAASALAATNELKDCKASCVAFLTNRKEIAKARKPNPILPF